MGLKLSTKIIISFSLIILSCMISFWVNLRLSSDVKKNAEQLTRSESILRNSGQIHMTILEMENAFRGFLLTDNERFLSAYYSGYKNLPRLFDDVSKLIVDSPDRIVMFDSIEKVHKQWLHYSEEIIQAKFDRLDPNIVSFEYDTLLENKLKKEVGKRIVEDVNAKLAGFELYEYESAGINREKLRKSMSIARMVSLVLVVVTALIGIVSAFYITRVISMRINSMVNLAKNISEGNFDHLKDEENDELTKLSHSLNIMSEKLKRSFLELDQFAHVVSHDLKAPLRGINNIISWIEEDFAGEFTPKLLDYFEKIKGRSLRMEYLISGLLEYSKIRAMKSVKEKVDVKSLLDEIIDSIVPESFTARITTEMPVLHTERLRLQQVFSNLISNAVKYNDGADGKIWIAARELEQYYEFTIKDNGVGIAPEYHQKIFGIFQTLRDKHDKESTGIGLSIVKRIIEEKRGTIRVESSAGKGANFIFTWPK